MSSGTGGTPVAAVRSERQQSFWTPRHDQNLRIRSPSSTNQQTAECPWQFRRWDIARREKLHELTVNSPAFVVKDKFIECLVCPKASIGFDVLAHVNGDKHQKKLCKYVTPAQHDAPALPPQQQGLTLAHALAAAEAMKTSKEQRLEQKRSAKRSRDEE